MKRTMVWPIRVFFILITRSNRMSHNLRNKRLSHELGSSLQCACLDSGARGCYGILRSRVFPEYLLNSACISRQTKQLTQQSQHCKFCKLTRESRNSNWNEQVRTSESTSMNELKTESKTSNKQRLKEIIMNVTTRESANVKNLVRFGGPTDTMNAMVIAN